MSLPCFIAGFGENANAGFGNCVIGERKLDIKDSNLYDPTL